MIEVERGSRLSRDVGGCCACDLHYNENGRYLAHFVKIINIGGFTIRLCSKCLAELKRKLRENL